MVRHNITRSSRPYLCNCITEEVVLHEDNNDKIPGEEPKFLLMNYVCEKHRHLASTTFKENHQELSKTVLDYIEEAKRLNLEDWQAAYDRCRTDFDRMDVQAQLPGIHQFNARITQEWQYLVSPPHAFDEHIHAQIKKEEKEFEQKQAQLESQ